MFDSKTLIDMLGVQVRVDFVKEAKCSPIFGYLYTWDPQSYSVVIARFENKDQKDPTDIILIPGTSVQNLEALEIGEEQNGDLTTNNETKNFMREENTEEFKTKINNLFLPGIASIVVDDCSEQMAIGELDMNDEGNREIKRNISEKIKIFEDFIQGKKKRLVDALRKSGLNFKEEGEEEEELEKGYLKENKNGSAKWLSKDLIKSKKRKGTITIGSGSNCVMITPPYEKENLTGNSSSVKRLMLTLATERVFEDLTQKDHFVGS